jgi:hypothetical protein
MGLPRQLYCAGRRGNRWSRRFSVWWASGLRLAWRRRQRAATTRQRLRQELEIAMRLAIFAVVVYLFILVVR